MIRYLPYPFLTYQVSDLVSQDIIAADKCEKQRTFMCLRLSLFTSQVAHQANVYPCISSMNTLGVFLQPALKPRPLNPEWIALTTTLCLL